MRCAAALVGPPTINSASYAEVSNAWLSSYSTMSAFKADLFKRGVISSTFTGASGWDVTFDCVYFCHAFITYAQEEYHKAAERVTNPPPGLAIIWIEYYRDSDLADAAAHHKEADGHAILLVLTDHGPIFFDPQTGIVTLSPTEVNSIFFRVA